MDELLAKYSEFEAKFKSIKADGMGEVKDDGMEECKAKIEYLSYMVESLSSYVKYLNEAFYQHQKGHIPPIKSVAQMEKALKNLGLESEYSVEKPSIYVSASRTGKVVSASYKKQ